MKHEILLFIDYGSIV